jgi:hypothetical protein
MNRILAVASGVLAFAVALHARPAPLPEPKSVNGISYVSGGIGLDESTAMKAQATNYPLSMVFSAGKDNEYVADVKVVIKDKAGNDVLNVVSPGPIMLVEMPAGRYVIAAEIHGDTLERAVEVRVQGAKRVYFHWPRH